MPWGKRKIEKIEKQQKKAAKLLDDGYTLLEAAYKMRKSPSWVSKAGHKFSSYWKENLKKKKRK